VNQAVYTGRGVRNFNRGGLLRNLGFLGHHQPNSVVADVRIDISGGIQKLFRPAQRIMDSAHERSPFSILAD
jgi:hypothetical protein